MEGVMDLSSETFNELENIPTAAGRGWLASNLKRDDWTVKLSNDAFREIATMASEMRSKPLPTLLRNPQQFEILIQRLSWSLVRHNQTFYLYR